MIWITGFELFAQRSSYLKPIKQKFEISVPVIKSWVHSEKSGNADFQPFFTLTPEGEVLKISILPKSPLGDLGVKWLFGVDSVFFVQLRRPRL